MKKSVLFFAKIIGSFLKLLPPTWVHASAAWVGFLWFDIFGFRKKIVLNNLKIAFPEWTDEQRYAVGRRSVYQLGHTFSELMLIPALTPDWIEKNMVFEGWDNLQAALAQKKGVLLLTLHLGNGDLGAAATAMKGVELNMISKRFKTKWFDDVWFTLRGSHGVNYIDAHGKSNAFDILKALKRNAAVIFVLDQFMGRPFGIPTTFFGKRTGTAYGLALFCQKTGAPVVPVYTYHDKEGKLHSVFEPALDTQKFIVEDKDETLSNLTQAFTDKIEEFVRKHPEQWMWVHRRWKDI